MRSAPHHTTLSPPATTAPAAWVALAMVALTFCPRNTTAQDETTSSPSSPSPTTLDTPPDSLSTHDGNTPATESPESESPIISADNFWPQWRGPHFNGVAPNGYPPTEWNEDLNVRWKIPLPGRGTSTPIVWNDKVFVLTAINTEKQNPEAQPAPKTGPRRGPFAPGRRFRPFGGKEGGRLFPTAPPVPKHVFQFLVLCIDRQTGATLWQHAAAQSVPHEGHHENNSFASASPVTDGERLYVSFGSRGIHCYSLDGAPLWSRDLGHMLSRRSFGEGASPTLAGNTLILNWDHEGQSFIVALDKFSGETLWRTDRDEGSTWSTPLPVSTPAGTQIVTNGHHAVRSYDLANGDLIWDASGQTERPVASPVAGLDHVFVASGYRDSKLSAIQLGHTGNLTATDAISWELDRNTPDIPSLLLSNDRLFFLARNSGMISCLDALTGTTHFGPERIGVYEVYASPVAADGHIFVAGRDGNTIVLKDDTTLEIVATKSLDDHFDASPAIAGPDLFLRGKNHLYCISQAAPTDFGKSVIAAENPQAPDSPSESAPESLPDPTLPPTTPATALDPVPNLEPDTPLTSPLPEPPPLPEPEVPNP
ncbi:MAG: PQQ-binding-like beta-propeller repeat protein [Verrucomicrobiota bacterium]